MSLEFRPPPDYLVQEYMNRKKPGEIVNEGVQQALQTYLAMQQQNQDRSLKVAGLAKDIATSQADLGQSQTDQIYGGIRKQFPELATATPTIPATAAGGQDTISLYKEYAADPLAFQQRYGNKMGQRMETAAKVQEGMKPQELYNPKGEKIGEIPHNGKIVNENMGEKTLQFVGTTADGKNGVYFDPNTKSFNTSPLPGGVPLSPKTPPTLPGGEAQQLGDFDNILNELQKIKENYDPGFVGMIDSRLQSGKQMTGLGASAKAAQFKASLGATRNKLLNLLSGAAISPAEYDRLLQQLPNEKSSEVDFLAKLGAFEGNIRGVMASRQKSFQGSGYRVPVVGQVSPVASPTGGWKYIGPKK